MNTDSEEGVLCEVCEKSTSSGYSENLEKQMCDECWDDYGEACHYGLA